MPKIFQGVVLGSQKTGGVSGVSFATECIVGGLVVGLPNFFFQSCLSVALVGLSPSASGVGGGWGGISGVGDFCS